MSDHKSNREKVCIVCIGKASSSRLLSEKNIELIRNFVRENYEVDDPDYPCGICNSCNFNVYEKARNPDALLSVAPFTPNRTHQLNSSSCKCQICSVAIAGFNDQQSKKKREDDQRALQQKALMEKQ